MTKFYLIGGALFIGSLLSIEIMNVIDASKMQKLNDQMNAEYYCLLYTSDAADE